jgi:hypothetical protein
MLEKYVVRIESEVMGTMVRSVLTVRLADERPITLSIGGELTEERGQQIVDAVERLLVLCRGSQGDVTRTPVPEDAAS